jgi:hypothetical protein
MISTLIFIVNNLSFSKLAIEDLPAPESPVIWKSGIIDVFLVQQITKKSESN